MTWADEGFIAHVRGGEVFSYQVCNHTTKIVVTSGEESGILEVKGVRDQEYRPTTVTVGREVNEIYAVA